MIIKAMFWVESRQIFAGMPQYYQTALDLKVGDEIIAPSRNIPKYKGRCARAKVVAINLDIADIPPRQRDILKVITRRYEPPKY
ncbi:MAG: hypothetical protein HUJ95_01900 [Bacteroidales bacterium]|nr:hypothetical protein [Bacteroidales bacterium]